ncbi:hypothetical protein BST61_g24 [Cercospora zeina]
MKAKFAADQDLVENNGRRGLEFTIVRPGGLSEEKGTGKIEAGKVHLKRVVPREDVARVVVECMRNEGTKGLAFDVVGGDELSVEEAVEKVVKGRVDTFEGRHIREDDVEGERGGYCGDDGAIPTQSAAWNQRRVCFANGIAFGARTLMSYTRSSCAPVTPEPWREWLNPPTASYAAPLGTRRFFLMAATTSVSGLDDAFH